jgi:3-hydroxyisobutyrate dehydrogenase-like beta-hydroxyacid dehydrogenase
VIALTHAAQALDAAESAVGHLGDGAFYADFATGDPGLKREIAKLARERGLRAIDGAVMNPVPLAGVATPVDLLRQLGEPPLTSEATRQVLESVPKRGVPAMQDDHPAER